MSDKKDIIVDPARQAKLQVDKLKLEREKAVREDRKKFIKYILEQTKEYDKQLQERLEKAFKSNNIQQINEEKIFKEFYESILNVYYSVSDYNNVSDALSDLEDISTDISLFDIKILTQSSKNELGILTSNIQEKIKNYFLNIKKFEKQFFKKEKEESKFFKRLEAMQEDNLVALVITKLRERKKKSQEKTEKQASKKEENRLAREGARIAREEKIIKAQQEITKQSANTSSDTGGSPTDRLTDELPAGPTVGAPIRNAVPSVGIGVGIEPSIASGQSLIVIQQNILAANELIIEQLNIHTDILQDILSAHESVFFELGDQTTKIREQKQTTQLPILAKSHSQLLNCVCATAENSGNILKLLQTKFERDEVRLEEDITEKDDKKNTKEKLEKIKEETSESSWLESVISSFLAQGAARLIGWLSGAGLTAVTGFLTSALPFVLPLIAATVVGYTLREFFQSDTMKERSKEVGERSTLGQIGQVLTDTAIGAGAGAAMGFAAGGVGAIPGAIIGAGVGFAGGMAQVYAGVPYGDEKKIREDQIKNLQNYGYIGDPKSPDLFARDTQGRIAFQNNEIGNDLIKKLITARQSNPSIGKDSPLLNHIYNSAEMVAKERKLGFQEGTKAAFGEWFNNFGKGTSTILHGEEAVVPKDQANSFVTDMLVNAEQNPVVFRLTKIQSELETIRKIATVELELFQESFLFGSYEYAVQTTGTKDNKNTPPPQSRFKSAIDDNINKDKEKTLEKQLGIPLEGAYPGETIAGGESHEGLLLLLKKLQEESGQRIEYISALNDAYHTSGSHNKGLAADIVLQGEEAYSIAFTKLLQDMEKKYQIPLLQKNEYIESSNGRTGRHFHVGLTQENAQLFVEAMRKEGFAIQPMIPEKSVNARMQFTNDSGSQIRKQNYENIANLSLNRQNADNNTVVINAPRQGDTTVISGAPTSKPLPSPSDPALRMSISH